MVDLGSLLVVAQVAVSLMLIVIAGLFVRSLQSVQAIDPGLDPAKLISAPLEINLLRYTRAQGQTSTSGRRANRAPPGAESATLPALP